MVLFWTGSIKNFFEYAAAGVCYIYASREHVTNLSDGFVQTRAFIHSGSSGGPVINSAGKIVAVVSQGGELELAKNRLVRFVRPEHFGDARAL